MPPLQTGILLLTLPLLSHCVPTVTLPSGVTLSGQTNTSASSDLIEVDAFLGVRYAEPPVGDLRFARPRPRAGTPGSTESARHFGPKCPQRALLDTTAPIEGDEDCLFINVWVPRAVGKGSGDGHRGDSRDGSVEDAEGRRGVDLGDLDARRHHQRGDTVRGDTVRSSSVAKTRRVHLTPSQNLRRSDLTPEPSSAPSGSGGSSSSASSSSSSPPLPVLVWIYGGGFTTGDASYPDYDPSTLLGNAGGGFIFVSFNYRVGPFGFFAGGDVSPDDDDLGGMQGIEDQQLALAWVKENIASFGGDPDRITVQGESAGSVSAAIHAVSPLSRGLARGFFMESSSCDKMAPNQTNVRATAAALAKKVGCDAAAAAGAGTGPQRIACLRGKSVDEIMDAATELGALVLFSPNQFAPAVDGRVLPRPCVEMFLDGDFERSANYVIGSNHDEMSLFLSLNPAWLSVNTSTLPGLVATSSGGDEAIVAHYTDLSKFGGSPLVALIRALSDGVMICNMRRLAKLTAGMGEGRTHLYSFNHAPAHGVFRGSRIFGAAHYFDVPYWFGTAPSVGNVIGAFEPDEATLSLRMQRFLATFALSGNPSAPLAHPSNFGPAIDFPEYIFGSNLTLNLNTSDLTPQTDRYEEACNLWDKAPSLGLSERYITWANGIAGGSASPSHEPKGPSASQGASTIAKIALGIGIAAVALGAAALFTRNGSNKGASQDHQQHLLA